MRFFEGKWKFTFFWRSLFNRNQSKIHHNQRHVTFEGFWSTLYRRESFAYSSGSLMYVDTQQLFTLQAFCFLTRRILAHVTKISNGLDTFGEMQRTRGNFHQTKPGGWMKDRRGSTKLKWALHQKLVFWIRKKIKWEMKVWKFEASCFS